MNIWIFLASLALFVLVALAGAFWLMGPERVWATLFGPADLGAVSFETLERRSTPNDALACPSRLCKAETDIMPRAYPVDVPTLRKAFLAAMKTERRLTRIHIDDRTPTDRFVQRSERLRFPDTIVVRYVALDEGGSSIAIYSRSQIGRSDLGVNQARIERWLDKLSREVARLKKNT